METRVATIADLQSIVSLLEEMRGENVDTKLVARQLSLFAGTPDRAILLVVGQDNDPLGMAVINLCFKLPKVECRIDEVIVTERARGKGLGSILMGACEAWAWEHDADVIEFTSRPAREAANHLYQKLGYDIRETNVYNKKKA